MILRPILHRFSLPFMQTARIYDDTDGRRILVDRLWPRRIRIDDAWLEE